MSLSMNGSSGPGGNSTVGADGSQLTQGAPRTKSLRNMDDRDRLITGIIFTTSETSTEGHPFVEVSQSGNVRGLSGSSGSNRQLPDDDKSPVMAYYQNHIFPIDGSGNASVDNDTAPQQQQMDIPNVRWEADDEIHVHFERKQSAQPDWHMSVVIQWEYA